MKTGTNDPAYTEERPCGCRDYHLADCPLRTYPAPEEPEQPETEPEPECISEFGPHDEHDDCERMLADMNPTIPDDFDPIFGVPRDYGRNERP